MSYYLIDYENVKVAGLNGIGSLSQWDKVVIFYSGNSESLTFGLHRRLMAASCEVVYQKVETGTKNALDFQLSSYLGYIIKENDAYPDEELYIVTNDNGFSVLSTYWKRKKVNVKIISDIAGNKKPVTPATVKPATKKAEKPDELRKAVSKVINKKADIDFVVSTVRKSRTRTEISNKFNSHFKDGQKSHEIFTAIKPFIKNMAGK